MPRFTILVPVSGTVAYIVDADNADKAKELLLSGDYYDCVDSGCHTEDFDSNTWEVYDD